jgi:hypothetical protein
MAIPIEESIQLPLLRVIADAGGELPLKEAIRQVGDFFPELTGEDKRRRLPSGYGFLFANRVQWCRQKLVELGHLYREPRGMWRITPQGKAFLEEKWSSWRPRYSATERGEGRVSRRLARLRIREGQRKDEELAPEMPALRPHEHLKELLRQVGDILGYYPETEVHESPYVYDVVWRTFLQAPRPSFVFEVQDKGNLGQ